MIVKVEIRGDRAYISGPPGSDFVAIEESAARLRPRFRQRGDAVGYFDAVVTVLGESKDETVRPHLADIIEIREPMIPERPW